MKRQMSERELDQKLKEYMTSGGEAAFTLDEQRVFSGIAAASKPRFSRRMQMVAASLVILLIAAFAIPPVRAAIGKLFTFIPGIGIVERGETVIYTMNPIISTMESKRDRAHLDNAVYLNKYLTVRVSGKGLPKTFHDATVYRNGEALTRDSASSSWGGNDGYASISFKVAKPAPEDVFSVRIDGFPDELTFTMTECGDYQTLADIGPTDTQNGISVTALASRSNEGKLEVWCYPFGLPEDRLVGIGELYYAGGRERTFIETESGFRSIYSGTGARTMERFLFDMPEEDASATLNIPYLSYTKDERHTVTLPVPEDYTTVPCDIAVSCSLGTIKITDITRKPNEYSAEKPDQIGFHIAFESADSGKVFYGLSGFMEKGRKSGGYMSQYDEEMGTLKYIETNVTEGRKKMTFTMSGLLYYQTGEYVIPLDIK